MLNIKECRTYESEAKKSVAREATAIAKVEAESYIQAVNIAKARIVYFITAESATEAGFNERVLRNVYGLEGSIRNAPGKSALYNKLNLAKWFFSKVNLATISTAEDVDSKVNDLAALYPSYSQALKASKAKAEKAKAEKAEKEEKSQNTVEFKAEGVDKFQAIKNIITRLDDLVVKGYFNQENAAELLESVKVLSKHLTKAAKPESETKTKAKTKAKTKPESQEKKEAQIVKIAA